MNTYTSIQNFLNVHIHPDLYALDINNFSIYTMEDKFGSVKDKFIVWIMIDASENKLASFTKNITNIYCLDSYVSDYHRCGIVATKEELVQISPKLSAYDVSSYNIYYYTVSHKTFTKATRYLSDTLHLDTSVNILNYDYNVVVDEDLDDDSFYVIIHCIGDHSIEEKLRKYKTLEELLRPYCDSFLSGETGWIHYILLAKNINRKFMAKFNLINESLDTEIYGIAVGIGFLKTFED